MNTQDNQDFWQQQITAWQVSDLSGAAFCREHGLTCHRFYYWRQKLLPTPRLQTDSSSGFAKVVPAHHPGSPGELMVSLPGGIAISGLHPGNIDLLGAILRQL